MEFGEETYNIGESIGPMDKVLELDQLAYPMAINFDTHIQTLVEYENITA